MVVRLAAKKYQHWIARGWNNVIWTYESSFEMEKLLWKMKVWHKVYKHYKWKCLVPTFKLDCVLVMIWDAFLGFHKNPLILMPPRRWKATHFIDNVYKRVLNGLYFLYDNDDNVLFMEDGTLVHRAHMSQQWRQAHGIRLLQWPAYSQDLNSIENVKCQAPI